MSPSFNIKIVTESTGEEEQGIFEFSEKEWSRIQRFNDEVNRLRTTKILRDGFNCQVKFNWKPETGLTADANLPADDDFAALLHNIRPFVLVNEEAYLPSICKILKRRIDLQSFRKAIDQSRDLFLGREFYQQIRIHANDTPINSEDTLMVWLNGFEYHRDSEKQAKIKEINTYFPSEGTKGLFVSMIIDKVHAIRTVNTIVECLKARDGNPIIIRN